MKLKVYEYKNCATCRKALRYLSARGLDFSTIPIREQPPTKAELKKMLKQYGGKTQKLFNTSGQAYKTLNLKAKLPTMSADEAINLLSNNGSLVKRPFVLTDEGGLVGFQEEEWNKLKYLR
jgi:arsenate reductase (glutaredoxin)